MNIHEAKTHLSKLLARVMNGEQVTFAKFFKPIATLVRLSKSAEPRLPGNDRDKVVIAPDFDEPLPELEL